MTAPDHLAAVRRGLQVVARVARRRRLALIPAIAAVAILGSGLVGSSPASAAGPAALTVDIVAVTPTVQSGEKMVWQVSYQCASVSTDCTGASLTVPIPTSNPDGIAASYFGATSGAPATGVSVVGSDIVWTFPDPLPAGSSGQVSFTLNSANLATPNGSTYTPVATMSATNATSVSTTPSAVNTVTVTSVTPHYLNKVRVGDPLIEPAIPGNVVYRISWGSSRWSVADGWQNGTWAVDDMVLTDTIPAGAEFVSASGGGTYSGPNPSDGTGVVTWPAIDESGGTAGTTVTLTLHYSSPPFTYDNDLNNHGDNVTNNADLVGQPYLRPNDPPVRLHADVTHGFQGGIGGSGVIRKLVGITGGRVEQHPRGATHYWATGITNTGARAWDFSVEDNMPCMFTSPTSTQSSPCSHANLGAWGDNFVVTSATAHDRFVDYRLTDGTTGTVTIPANTTGYYGVAIPGVGPSVSLSDFRMYGTLEAGEHSAIQVNTTINPALPSSAPAGTPYLDLGVNPIGSPGFVGIENCVGQTPGTATYTYDGVSHDFPFVPSEHCATNVVPEANPNIYHVKRSSNSVQAPGGVIDFSLFGANQEGASAPWYPVVIDPIPANLEYVPGSATVTMAPGDRDWAGQMNVEYIPDFNGTGQAFLRLTWPSDWGIEPRLSDSHLQISFKARVKAGAPPGDYVNYGVWMDGKSDGDVCWRGLPQQPDAQDMDSDGVLTDNECVSPVAYTVTQGAGATVDKQVRGSLDSTFQRPPGVGRTVSGADSTFRVNVVNTGNVPLREMVAYDILPYLGDKGVSGPTADQDRGTEWVPTLNAPVTAPARTTVEYSKSTNPCRGEVFTAGGTRTSAPAGCVDDWSATPPSPLSATKALRFVITGPIAAGDKATFDLAMASKDTDRGIAWNTGATSGQRDDDGTFILPTESPKVGLEAVPLEFDKELVDVVDNGDETSTVTYSIDVTNPGTTATKYSLDDHLRFTDQVTVLSAVVTNTAPGDIVISPTWNGLDDIRLVTDQPIGAGVTDSYEVEVLVRTTKALSVEEGDCTLGFDESGTGLLNIATLHVGSETFDDNACAPLEPGTPAISIVKYTNDEDADEAPGPTVEVGSEVTWKYVVENTGELLLTQVTVTDDKVDASEIDCGDGTNVIPALDVGEEATCYAKGIAVVGQYENMGSVVGTPSHDDGTPIDDMDQATDDNPSHYNAPEPAEPPTTTSTTTAPPALEPPVQEMPVTGSTVLPLVTLGLSLVGMGAIVLTGRRRRRLA